MNSIAYFAFHVNGFAWTERSAAHESGPISVNKPKSELPPGPPCSQMTSGALTSPFCAGKCHQNMWLSVVALVVK